ncbi:MAG: radical SAM protein [Thermoprotei archaeon]|nr:MAG: radical SAM protein [Thermoprotei archaeon]
MGRLVRPLIEKQRIAEKLRDLLDDSSLRKAEKDHHAKRRPRPCGMTIHTGIGCSYGCVYCYVPDMGFPMKPRPYPLSPLELVYALSINPYVVPSRTLAAYGSVTEPFMEVTKSLASQYIVEVYRWLRLPSQVSTKACVDSDVVKILRNGDPKLNILISVITLSMAKLLEPRAPDPLERIKCAARSGFPVTLFVRPVIPRITEKEISRILDVALSNGVRTVVFGALRITPGIIKRLESIGVDTSFIEKLVTRSMRSSRDQVPISLQSIRPLLISEARRRGMVVLPSACAANIYVHDDYCYMCNFGPCGNKSSRIVFDEGDVHEVAEFMGLRVAVKRVNERSVTLLVTKYRNREQLDVLKVVLSTTTRTQVRILPR